MKYQAFVILLFFVQIGFGQRLKPNYYELTREVSITGQDSFQDKYQFSITKQSGFNKSSGLLELHVYNFEVQHLSDSLRNFSSDGSVIGVNLMSRLDIVSTGYLLEHPILLKMENGVVHVDSLTLNKQINEQLQQWKIEEDYHDEVIQSLYRQIYNLASNIFLSDFTGLTEKDFLGKNIVRNNKDYVVLSNERGIAKLQYDFKDSSTFIHSSIHINSKDLSTLNLNSEEKHIINHENKIVNTAYKRRLQLLKEKPSKPKMNGLVDMLITSSNWSNYFKKGNTVDSLALMQFIEDNDGQFSNFPVYVNNKLSGMQRLTDDSLYYQNLQKTSNVLLKGTHHLSNKIRNVEISIDEFKELSSLLNEEQLYDYIQNDLSQQILSSPEKLSRLKVLVNETTNREKQASVALLKWYEVKNSDLSSILKKTLEDFLNYDDNTWLVGNIGRYALLVQKQLFQVDSMDLTYLDRIIAKLKPLTVLMEHDYGKIQKSHLAYANFLAYEHVNNLDADLGFNYLKEAKDFSAKLSSDFAYHSNYDLHFLKSKKSYADDYYRQLAKLGKVEEGLKEFTKEYATNPGANFKKLRDYYNEHHDKNTFAKFYKSQVIQHLPDAPTFLLTNLEGKEVSKSDFAGKWTVVDFWGTWCVPCVQEMPKLNAYYLDLQKQENSKIEFITIACYDRENAVKEFLTQNNYSIPVLMSDNKVQREFAIRAYPTKVIITPEGKMLNTDRAIWQEQVKELSEL